MGDDDRELAIDLPPKPAGELPLHADRVPPFLRDDRVVHDPDPRPEFGADERPVAGEDLIGLPGAMADEVLQRLGDGGGGLLIGYVAGDRLDVLPAGAGQEAPEVQTEPP